MNVPFLQDTTFTGLISTRDHGTSIDWYTGSRTIVESNSATNWIYKNTELSSVYKTISEYAVTAPTDIYPGHTVTLYNGKVYVFAGNNSSNPDHYLEINPNPITPIYREIPQTTNETIVDSFSLGDFKSAKYTLQVETNYNNDIYFSEINVVGSVTPPQRGVACEYGQIYTAQIVLGYAIAMNVNNMYLVMYFSNEGDPNKKLIVKGHRSNFYI